MRIENTSGDAVRETFKKICSSYRLAMFAGNVSSIVARLQQSLPAIRSVSDVGVVLSNTERPSPKK